MEVFYSGDRGGNLSRVDCTGVGDMGDGECVFLGREVGDGAGGHGEAGYSDGGGEGGRGYEGGIGGGEGLGINSIVAMDEEWVWTCTEKSSVSRWRDVGSKKSRRGKGVNLPAPGKSYGSLPPGLGSGSGLNDDGKDREREHETFDEEKKDGINYSHLIRLESIHHDPRFSGVTSSLGKRGSSFMGTYTQNQGEYSYLFSKYVVFEF